MSRSIVPGNRRRAVFISDVHLGARHCHADELATFLSTLQCGRLYLVGDIVDLWWLAQRRAAWSQAHNRVVEALHTLRRAGTELIYIPGNHDRPIRRFCGLVLPSMQVRRRTIHVTADGRRLLVTHGDDYDGITHFGGLQERFGDWLYYRILTGNRLLNRMRRRLGLRYWSLSEFLKRRSSAAERYIERFVQAGLDDARRRGLDGIVCGHIHRAGLVMREGLIYANDGDWVESLTALAEDADGTLRLLSHTGDTLALLPPRLRLVSDAVLPKAA
ncbi:UDP-2,3-diacylglucosamine pyrophosphatase LpxH [Luteimonas cucumeris]|uniref:UDP-2,3-diacylglucosamine pyrophosphatase LpxH n=1 Tax=Luteimonas cucumeris TaxID=985012 RepID=A0A562LFA1_9GAMM|nr:UDP-2,3-diacylglucosamine diphosphatase [Luteimonas cucumeris]TWI06283.1 UDP-2,3-diacylglucosamine pyrophosphatase LpxH [Luteimonas cucumeris]